MESPVLVSACLLGFDCTYSGGDERRRQLAEVLQATGRPVVPVCPEVAGGLPTPRPRCEVDYGDGAAVLDGVAGVRDAGGADHSATYVGGAQAALAAVRRHAVEVAVLKDRSPSCGCRGVYDGTHTRTLRARGLGVTAALLAREGVVVLTEDEAVARLQPEPRAATVTG